MRIIKASSLKAFWARHSDAEASLRMWVTVTKSASWQSFADVRKTFPSADCITVASGRTVVIFNIAHNRYRMIAAIHYKSRIIFTLMVLSHKEYDRNNWKEQL